MEKQIISDISIQNNIDRLQKFIPNEKACILEEAIRNFTKEYCINNNIPSYLYLEIYDTKLNHILNNLDEHNNIKNTWLRNAIINEEINVQDIPYYKPQEIFPEHWKFIINKLETIEHKRKNMNVVELFPCKKCGCKKHAVQQLQTRSCDEPMTTFITCQMCGNTIKKG